MQVHMLTAGKHSVYLSSTQLGAEDFIFTEAALLVNITCGMTEWLSGWMDAQARLTDGEVDDALLTSKEANGAQNPEYWEQHDFVIQKFSKSSTWYSRSVLPIRTFWNGDSKMLTVSHMWLLRTWNVASATEQSNLRFYINSHRRLIDTIVESAVLEFSNTPLHVLTLLGWLFGIRAT